MENNRGPLLPHGGYRKLRSYAVAEAIYDATAIFCRRFLPRDRRMTDQMVQAARSGVRNISEGSGAAATSRKSEMKLTNVARASLADELLPDYISFLRQNRLPVWEKDSPAALKMRRALQQDPRPGHPAGPEEINRPNGLSGLAEFAARAAPEEIGNAMICAIHQADYLLRRQIKSQERVFLEQGGFSESLYRSRSQAREFPRTAPLPRKPGAGDRWERWKRRAAID